MSENTAENAVKSSPWRRLWHLLGGALFPVLAVFLGRGWMLAITGGALVFLVSWEVTRFRLPGVNRWMASHLKLVLKKKEVFRPTGTTYLVLASLAVFFLFEKYIAITSLAFLALGDFMAVTIGQKYGRHRIFRKSLEGSLACLTSCLLVGVIMWSSAGLSLSIVLVGAVVATVTELLPLPLDDNLTVPLVSAGAMALVSLV